jgi:hypothetical protein
MSTWNDSDDALLIKLYKDDKLDFLPLCTKLKRKCKDTSQRIIHLKLETHKNNIRGFNTNKPNYDKPNNYNKSDTNKTDITNNTDNINITTITNKPNTDLKTPTEDLRKQTNIIFDQIDNIYQVFNSITNIYSNITNITATPKQDV